MIQNKKVKNQILLTYDLLKSIHIIISLFNKLLILLIAFDQIVFSLLFFT